MQNLEIQNFARQAGLLLPDTSKRRLILPVLIGMAIGNFLQVKQGEELNPIVAFNDSHLGNVSRAVSALNEEFIIDVSTAIEAAKSQYLVRHRILNCQPVEYSVNPEFELMAIAVGLSVVMPVEVYNAVKETGLSSSQVMNRANLLIGKLKKDGVLSI